MQNNDETIEEGSLQGESLKIQLFGRFEMRNSEGYLDEDKIRSEMLTKLLVYFFCHRNGNITVQELGEVLWPDDTSDNPAGALKNLMYRLRTIIKKEWGGKEFIMTGRGSYSWNPAYELEIDTEQFEEDCKMAAKAETDEDKILYYKRAVISYKGMFVPKLSGEYWVTSLATYYHSTYLAAVKKLADILSVYRRYEEMAQICSMAISLDNLDEELHCWFIKALIGQNKQNLAVEHYQKTVDLLYENLGIRPSKELRDVYEELLKQQHEQELDLSKIQKELKADDSGKGAFLCEYGVFKKSYHLEIRRAGRLGMSIYLSLITLYPTAKLAKDSDVYQSTMKAGMDLMQQVLLSSLRTGDVISKYSASQFIVMLPTCQYETATMVMERIQEKFYESDKKRKLVIRYSVDEIDLD